MYQQGLFPTSTGFSGSSYKGQHHCRDVDGGLYGSLLGFGWRMDGYWDEPFCCGCLTGQSCGQYSGSTVTEGPLASAAGFEGAPVGTVLSGESLMCPVKPAVLLFRLAESTILCHPFYT